MNMSCHFENYHQSPRLLCIQSDLSQISFQKFWQDVAAQAAQMVQFEQDVWALWQQDSYEFLVLLFAALNAGKQVLLPPHRVRDLENELAAEQIYFLERLPVNSLFQPLSLRFDDTFVEQSQLYFYTSGSTGKPKKIPRSLKQLFNEVGGLDASFQLPEQAIAIATVSHQHIYGLLFKLLWPLASGRAFYQAQVAFPEDVVDIQKNIADLKISNYVITSPALLKRWTSEVVLHDNITAYSSGGKLEEGIRPTLAFKITEVFGSSETGGIAYREADALPWTPFSNVQVKHTEQQELAVKATHAFSQDWIFTGDQVELATPNNPQSAFKLLGRLDRIVKLEEKRISLDAIEHKLLELNMVEQCHVLVFEKEHRQILASVVVLTEAARRELIDIGKAKFVSRLKIQLKDKLENIAIPRQWRFLTQIPQNAQSKINKVYLKSLFQNVSLPVVLSQDILDDQMQQQLEFIPELDCFKGHFPNCPIYPGVGQIGFIQYFAKQYWADLAWCNGMEQLKFQSLIRPYMTVTLNLKRKEHKISFELKTEEKTLASGRLVFALAAEQSEQQA